MRRFHKSLVSLVLVMLVALVAAGADAASITLRLGHEGSVTDPRQEVSLMFARLVSEKTKGQVEIKVYPASTLGTKEEMQEGLQVGTVDIVLESLGSLERYSPLAGIEGLPFLFRDMDHWLKVWNGPIGDEIVASFEKDSGYLLLGRMVRGPRHLTARRPVRGLEDLRGLKIRVPTQPTYVATWKNLGASPAAMAFAEVFTALQQGVIDAQENPLDTILFASIHEVAPFITLTGHLVGGYHFQVWSKRFHSYPENVQKAMQEAADEAAKWYSDLSVRGEKEYLQRLRNEGATIITIDPEVWKKPVMPLYDSAHPKVKEWAARIAEVR